MSEKNEFPKVAINWERRIYGKLVKKLANIGFLF